MSQIKFSLSVAQIVRILRNFVALKQYRQYEKL